MEKKNMKLGVKQGIKKIKLPRETVFGMEDTKTPTSPSTAGGYCWTYQLHCTDDGNCPKDV